VSFRTHLISVCILFADDEDNVDDNEDVDGAVVYRLQWFPESCSDGRTMLGETALVTMSASTQVSVVLSERLGQSIITVSC